MRPNGVKNPKDQPSKEKDQDDEKTLPIYQRLLKCEHADDETITAQSFPFDELYPRWRGDEFNPDFMNAATGVVFSKAHHVKGKAQKQRRNFANFEFAFCLNWMLRNIDGKPVWDRCYNTFTVKSGGCMIHPKTQFRDGPNKIFEAVNRGDVATWGDLKNPMQPEGAPPVTDAQYHELAADWATARIEDAVEVGLPSEHISPQLFLELNQWLEAEKKIRETVAGTGTASSKFSLGTYTPTPVFVTQALNNMRNGVAIGTLPDTEGNEGQDLVPEFENLDIQAQATAAAPVLTARQKYGKKSTVGRPDLDAKVNQQPKARGKTHNSVQKGFAEMNKKDGKPRRAKGGGDAMDTGGL
ncbi:hypothetical protein N0V94_008819 [Neodidymelliopsis sp. IMI 364377]|nr:hypothetical protein N0V94_008819 [Neodidymelliopsis sp. IMI 364377]